MSAEHRMTGTSEGTSIDEAHDPLASIEKTGAVTPAAAEAKEQQRLRWLRLLRREAQRVGLLDADDLPDRDDVGSEAAVEAIEALLERELKPIEPDEAACRRHYEAHAPRFAGGERVHARHILFAVTPGVDVRALTARAEALLLELRCAPDRHEAFTRAARTNSNCPSGADGGDLGWIGAADCAPEFAREIFGRSEIGVLPRLLRSRFGLHVVDVMEREPGEEPPWEEARVMVARELSRQAWVTALRRYLEELAAADEEGAEARAAR